jgi:hypothetical protein
MEDRRYNQQPKLICVSFSSGTQRVCALFRMSLSSALCFSHGLRRLVVSA